MSLDPNLKLLRTAYFLQSAASLEQCPPDIGFEVAFVGRSNAGKSSVLNRVTDNKSLARTSKTPGRTQLLNFFSLDDSRRLVDLPGYGFAKVAAKTQRGWEAEMARYLDQRKSLKGLVLVMDVRHPLQDMDRNFIAWSCQSGVPVRALLNKADKLGRGQAKDQLFKVVRELGDQTDMVEVQLFSALKGSGVEELAACLAGWLDLNQPETRQS